MTSCDDVWLAVKITWWMVFGCGIGFVLFRLGMAYESTKESTKV